MDHGFNDSTIFRSSICKVQHLTVRRRLITKALTQTRPLLADDKHVGRLVYYHVLILFANLQCAAL